MAAPAAPTPPNEREDAALNWQKPVAPDRPQKDPFRTNHPYNGPAAMQATRARLLNKRFTDGSSRANFYTPRRPEDAPPLPETLKNPEQLEEELGAAITEIRRSTAARDIIRLADTTDRQLTRNQIIGRIEAIADNPDQVEEVFYAHINHQSETSWTILHYIIQLLDKPSAFFLTIVNAWAHNITNPRGILLVCGTAIGRIDQNDPSYRPHIQTWIEHLDQESLRLVAGHWNLVGEVTEELAKDRIVREFQQAEQPPHDPIPRIEQPVENEADQIGDMGSAEERHAMERAGGWGPYIATHYTATAAGWFAEQVWSRATPTLYGMRRPEQAETLTVVLADPQKLQDELTEVTDWAQEDVYQIIGRLENIAKMPSGAFQTALLLIFQGHFFTHRECPKSSSWKLLHFVMALINRHPGFFVGVANGALEKIRDPHGQFLVGGAAIGRLDQTKFKTEINRWVDQLSAQTLHHLLASPHIVGHTAINRARERVTQAFIDKEPLPSHPSAEPAGVR